MDAQTITAIGLLVTAVGGVLSPILIYLNGRASKARAENQVALTAEQTKKIEEVAIHTDGLATALANASLKQGTAEGKAVGLEQGRDEAK